MEFFWRKGPCCGLLLFAGINDWAVKDWGGKTGDGWGGRCRGEVEDDDFVSALTEPRAGDEESLLRTDLPEAADRVAIDPQGSFSKVPDVEECVAYGS